jgi:plastocyanin
MHLRTLLGLPVMFTLAAAACGGGTPAPAPEGQGQPKPAASAAAVDPATAATIKGKVTFGGTAPTNAPIKMNADPFCVTANKTPQTQETYMVGKGGEVGNVFVYVSDGLGDRTFLAPSDPVVINQENCRYHPHVLGLMVGQPLQILNSDGTLHNIHALPKKNAEFNIGQPFKGMETLKKFETPEVPLRFKCDVHKWMGAYAGVFNHPFFAVTNDQGTFEIKNLPPGNYVIEAWHEKYGTQTQNVTVSGSEPKTVDFTFKG